MKEDRLYRAVDDIPIIGWLFPIVIVLGFLTSVATVVAIGYVAYHFLMKVW